MKGEIIQNIYNPQSDEEWVLIETNKTLYSMRLGGFKVENNIHLCNSDSHWEKITIPFNPTEIKNVYTDDEWVYLILDCGNIVAFGWVGIEIFGDMELGIKFTNITEYESDFFESSSLYKLTVDSDGWSSKVP